METIGFNKNKINTTSPINILKYFGIIISNKFFNTAILFLILFATLINNTNAAIIHPCYSDPNCTSNDFELVEVYLGSDTSGTRLNTNDCNGTLPVTAYYCLRIKNNTSSSRIGIYVNANVSTSGNISNVTYCFDKSMPANLTVLLVVPAAILWNCASPISITESVSVWSTGSGNICPGNSIDCGNTTKSKCRGGGAFPVNTPLVSNFTFSKVCRATQQFQTVTFTDSSFGGDYPNVTYIWNFGAGASPASANTIGPHVVNYTSAGAKTINLTVSNQDASTSTRTKSVVVGTCCAFNVTCPNPFTLSLCCEQLIPAPATNLIQLQQLGFTISLCGTLGILSSDLRINGSCPNDYTINRTYTIYDDLNSNHIMDPNESSQTCLQTIIIKDTTKPIFVGQ